ncbi:MAG: adenylate/guanylate cyclase domain-containing protein, partial [Candidatus Marinimicrobia bacterium]|nr:adenylate/guanylate cyclase domain-containing protein [Candidatus Neomarinimicrobiota bacterium]
TLLDENYVNVMGGQLTELIYGYPLSHTILIAFLSLIAFFILSYLNPVTAGILIILEGFIYYAIVCGVFVNDLFWFIKSTLASIFPEKLMSNNPNLFNTSLPDIGESYVIPLVAPLAGLLVTYTGNVIYKFIVEQKDKKFLKNTFGAYISPDLIDQMYADKREPKLGGEAGYHTAFFSDIQSFSSFSEVLEPKKMVSLMNQYLTEMTNILLDHKGTLDKYIGDAIVAFYGAPVPLKDHEFHACLTALEMEKKLAIMRSEWANDSDWPELVHNIRHRVGLNSGEMVTGNMGSSMRMNYTMMGDTVNLAARLEPAAKHYGVYILVSEHTQKAVEDFFEWRFLDFLRVKGKKKPVRGYELISLKNEMTKDQSQLVQAFDEGIKLYNKQEWTKAKKLFKESLSMEEKFIDRPTTPSEVYLDRCDYFKAEPPGKNWDGIWTMKTK